MASDRRAEDGVSSPDQRVADVNHAVEAHLRRRGEAVGGDKRAMKTAISVLRMHQPLRGVYGEHCLGCAGGSDDGARWPCLVVDNLARSEVRAVRRRLND